MPAMPSRRNAVLLTAVAAAVAVLVVVALVLSSSSARSPREATGAASPPPSAGPEQGRSLDADFLGVNGGNIRTGRANWSNPVFLQQVKALHPENLRLFAGSTANYWDWETGRFSTSPLTPKSLLREDKRQPPLPFETLAAAVKASGATPIYVLNMVTDTLDHQLALLKRARELGLPVTRVELGNEFYLRTGESAAYPGVFKTGADYGRVATEWISRIKSDFPGVRIAAVAAVSPSATSGKNKDPRRVRWNSDLFSTLKGADAVTLHTYFGLTKAAGGPEQTSAALTTAADARDRQLLADIASLPSSTRVWLTEYNLIDSVGSAYARWMHGLVVARYTADLMSMPQIELVDLHLLVGQARFTALLLGGNGIKDLLGKPQSKTGSDGEGVARGLEPPDGAGRTTVHADVRSVLLSSPAAAAQQPSYDLSATGSVLSLLAELLRAHTAVHALDPAALAGLAVASPTPGSTAAPVVGVALDGGSRAVVLVNSGAGSQKLDLRKALGADRAQQVSYDDPLDKPIVGTVSLHSTRTTAQSGAVAIPPYSVTILTGS